MKKELHPSSYRMVIIRDISTGDEFLTRSCAVTRENSVFAADGKEYPLLKMEITSASHPFFTGKMSFVDTAGRIDKFNKKFANFKIGQK